MSKAELKAKALAEIEKRLPEFKQLLGDVIRIPTDNPPGDTTECTKFIVKHLKSKGLSVEIYEPKIGNPNVVSYIKGKSPGPNLILNGHIDQFPVGSTSDWSFNPYSGECKDGKILGRGACDMKGGSVISLICFQLVHELGIPIKGQLTLTLVSDEETGGTWGAKWLVENVPSVRGDSFLNGEPTGLDSIWVAHKGIFWLKVKTVDPGGHGALPGEENAITKAMKVALAIREIQGWKLETPGELAELVKTSKQKLEQKAEGRGRGWVLDSTSVNVGVIQGGDKVNVIPRHCEVIIDIRVPNGITLKDLQAKVDEAIRKTGLNQAEISTEWIETSEPSYSSGKSDLVNLLRANAKTIIGEEPTPIVVFCGSDGRFWLYRGIPQAVYGPTAYSMGGANEYILEKEFEQALKVHAATIIDYLCD
jgi:succinyl-diaminopimelate desuccinylase